MHPSQDIFSRIFAAYTHTRVFFLAFCCKKSQVFNLIFFHLTYYCPLSFSVWSGTRSGLRPRPRRTRVNWIFGLEILSSAKSGCELPPLCLITHAWQQACVLIILTWTTDVL